MAIFSVIDGLIFIIFFNRENFEQVELNIQIWEGVLHNIKIQKCYFLPGNSIDYQRDTHYLRTLFWCHLLPD